jgi:hypothetical protein
MLLNADWGFFAPLRLCVIFALKKISLAEVFGYAPVKILNKTLASRLCSRRVRETEVKEFYTREICVLVLLSSHD